MNQGFLYGVLAYLTWGLLPLYWKVFQEMPAGEILAHRIVWSFLFVGALLLISRRWKLMLSAVREKRKKWAMILCSLTISANWLIFIWAVNAGHVMETSLGYYINPLISVLFAVFFLKERLGAGQWLAIALAAVGVAIMTVQYGRVPWVALSLALSFAMYGLAKKAVSVDAMISLAWETVIVFPLSLLYLVFIHVQGTDTAFGLSGSMMLLLTLAGAATAMPLYWFAQATQRLPLSTVGFIQYIAPSTSLLLAVFVFHEPFTTIHLISFAFIWSALFVFTFASIRQRHAAKPAAEELALKTET